MSVESSLSCCSTTKKSQSGHRWCIFMICKVAWCTMGWVWWTFSEQEKTKQGIVEIFQRHWKLTCPAVWSHPAIQADLGPWRLAAVVAEVVVTRNTQLVALAAVVVLVTAHSDTIDEASHRPVVQDGLPGVAGVNHTGVNAAFNQQLLLVWNKNNQLRNILSRLEQRSMEMHVKGNL